MTLFSIITVTRENISGLKQTALSVRGQSCDDYEWIVIDGGSQDGTPEYLTTLDGVDWISERDRGIYHAMNKGLERANGRYVIFMNAGDCFAGINNLALIRGKIKKGVPGFLYGDALEGGHLKPARSHSKRAWGMFTHHQSMIYKRDVLGDMQFDEDYLIASDYHLTCRFLKRCENVCYINAPLCDFEAGGVSQRSALQGRVQQFQIRRALKICNSLTNILIFALQGLSFAMRRLMPKLYWSLKTLRFHAGATIKTHG